MELVRVRVRSWRRRRGRYRKWLRQRCHARWIRRWKRRRRQQHTRAAVGAVGAEAAIRVFGSRSAIVASTIGGVHARLSADLRAGEAHHQGEEEHAGKPRRGPKAARRAAPSRGLARGRGGDDGTTALGRRHGGTGRGGKVRRKGLDGTVQYRAEHTEHRQQHPAQILDDRDHQRSLDDIDHLCAFDEALSASFLVVHHWCLCEILFPASFGAGSAVLFRVINCDDIGRIYHFWFKFRSLAPRVALPAGARGCRASSASDRCFLSFWIPPTRETASRITRLQWVLASLVAR